MFRELLFKVSEEQLNAIKKASEEERAEVYKAMQKKFDDTLYYFWGCRSLTDIKRDKELLEWDEQCEKENKELFNEYYTFRGACNG